jgi:phosphoribosyl-dephospho-CoA transferase
MEIGSKEHKALLRNAIVKTALRTFSLGALIGLMLIVPLLVRENSFSQMLAKIGISVIAVSLIYAGWVALSKAKKVFKDL